MKSNSILFLILALLGPFALTQAKIYYSTFENRPWQTCYTGSLEAAQNEIEQRRFSEGTYWENVKVISSGTNLLVTYTSYGQEIKRTFQKCSFREGDELKSLKCQLTVQTPRNNSDDMPWAEMIKLHKIWSEKSSSLGFISCQDQKIQAVKNKWVQNVSLRDFYLAREIVGRGERLIVGAGGGVETVPGLFSHQNWKAKLDFHILTTRNFPELCDASVEQLSLESASGLPMQSGWCPWAIEIVDLKCDGRKNLHSNAPEFLPLDLQVPEVKEYCEAQLRD